MTLTPTVAVFEEYNDNILLNNLARRSDWVTGVTPGFTLAIEGGTYRLAGGYSFTAEAYARESSLSEVFSRQNLSLDGAYHPSRLLTLTLTDSFVASVNTNLVAPTSVATGRSRAWSNTVTPGAVWQLTPVTTLHLSGTHVAQRFERSDLAESDDYRASGALERRLTSRLSGTAGYQLAYLDVEGEPGVTTHTPRLGALYRFTETLTGFASAGPTFELGEGGRDRVTPAATASLRQELSFGSVAVDYDRAIGTAGGLGGTTDNEMVGGLLRITTVWKGLALELGPRYTSARSDDGRIDVRTLTLILRSSYRLTTWMSVFAGYSFFQQRSASTSVSGSGLPLAGDIDQNRMSIGLQVGYPMGLD
ncbi:MAG: hypothetical protein HY727_17560 [Candidatus Rokubacteria bacterium]|nr:hypothetical protein [Candidatus Rokubacteria bacterium]